MITLFLIDGAVNKEYTRLSLDKGNMMNKAETEQELSKIKRLLLVALAANKSLEKEMKERDATIRRGNIKLESSTATIARIRYSIEAIAATLHPNVSLGCGPVTIVLDDTINPETINEPQTLSILRYINNLTLKLTLFPHQFFTGVWKE